MNAFALVILVFSMLSATLHLTKAALEELERSSYSFQRQRSECSSASDDYWEQSYPSECIPPPTDAATYWIPRGASPPALCLFVQALQTNQPTGIKGPTGEDLSCNYL